MFCVPNKLSERVHNKLVTLAHILPKLCFPCRQICKVHLCTSFFCSHTCVEIKPHYLSNPLPVPSEMTVNEFNEMKDDENGVFLVHKKKKVLLPEDIDVPKSKLDNDDDSLTDDNMDEDVSVGDVVTSPSSEKKRGNKDPASSQSKKKKGKKRSFCLMN